jgi:hypothetical protein
VVLGEWCVLSGVSRVGCGARSVGWHLLEDLVVLDLARGVRGGRHEADGHPLVAEPPRAPHAMHVPGVPLTL